MFVFVWFGKPTANRKHLRNPSTRHLRSAGSGESSLSVRRFVQRPATYATCHPSLRIVSSPLPRTEHRPP